MATGVRGVSGQFALEANNNDRVRKDFGKKISMSIPLKRRGRRRGKR